MLFISHLNVYESLDGLSAQKVLLNYSIPNWQARHKITGISHHRTNKSTAWMFFVGVWVGSGDVLACGGQL